MNISAMPVTGWTDCSDTRSTMRRRNSAAALLVKVKATMLAGANGLCHLVIT